MNRLHICHIQNHGSIAFSFFFSSRRRHTRSYGDWSSDVCSSDLWLLTPFLLSHVQVHYPCVFDILRSLNRRKLATGSFGVMTFGSRMSFPDLIWIDSAPVNGLVRFFQFLQELVVVAPYISPLIRSQSM